MSLFLILRLLFLFLVGGAFYKLAKSYEKMALGYTLIGIASYFVGKFIGALIVDGFGELSGMYSYEYSNLWLLELFAIPYGLLTCWGSYKLLQRNWRNKEKFNPEGTDLAEQALS